MSQKNTEKYHRFSQLLLTISIIVLGIALVIGCVYIYFTGESREQIYTREIVAETLFAVVLVPFAFFCFCLLANIVLGIIYPVKQIKKPTKFIEKKTEETKGQFNKSLKIKVVVLAIGLLFFILGLSMGGTEDVITKAAKICTECIGLG